MKRAIVGSAAFLLLLNLRLPLSAQVPDVEACSEPGLEVISTNTGLHSDSLDVVDVVAIAEAAVSLELATDWVGDFSSIQVSSPSGTLVTLHSSGGSFASNFDLTYSDDGDPNLGLTVTNVDGSPSIYSCSGCPIQATGPGLLGDFAGDASDGTWTLSFTTFNLATLDEWCVQLYEIAPTPRVSGLACVETASGVAEVSWTNEGAYDAIEIHINRELVASLAGPFVEGAAETFTSSPLGAPGVAEICVKPSMIGTGDAYPTCCTVYFDQLAATVEDVQTPAAPFAGPMFLSYVGTFSIVDSFEIADVQFDLDLTHPWLGGFSATLARPLGTSVTLHGGQGAASGAGDDFIVTYWDLGRPNAAPYDCACLMQIPFGYGELHSFVGELSDGDWTISIFPSFSDEGTINTTTLRLYDTGPPYQVDGLACVAGADQGTLDISFTHAAAVDSVRIYVNRELEATLAGPFIVGEQSSYTTSVQTAPSIAEIGVQGVAASGATGPMATCNAHVTLPPVTDIDCEWTSGSGVVTVTWTNPLLYDEIQVFEEGVFAATLLGDATEYMTTELPLDDTAEICVRGVLTTLGSSSERCCRALLVSAPDAEACDSVDQLIAGTLSDVTATVTVAEALWIEEVEMLLDLTTTFVSDWDINLTSPSGEQIKIHDNLGGTDNDGGFLLIYDDAGIPSGNGDSPVDYGCGCRVQPPGPGELNDFLGEFSDGDWTLTMNTFSEGTLDNWCIRIFGCAVIPPSGVTCDEIGSDVTISWANGQIYDSVEVFRDGALIATLAGTATSYVDAGVAGGRYGYQVQGTSIATGCSSITLPCRASVGFEEFCGPEVDIVDASSAEPIGIPVAFADSINIGDVEVVFQMDVTFSSDWDVSVVSPYGTTVKLNDNNGSLGEYDVIWSDAGDPVSFVNGYFNCGGCLVLPTGPGTLADFSGENSQGDWSLELLGFGDAEIELLCISVYVGCAADPPVDVTCTSVGNDIEVAWTSPGTYSSIQIERNGLVVAEVAPTATSFLDELALGGRYAYRVIGVSTALACESGSPICRIQHLLEETCNTTVLALPAAATTASTIEILDDYRVQEVEVSLNKSDSFGVTNATDISLISPAGTTVGLYDGRSVTSNTGNMVVLFSESGVVLANTVNVDCDGCFVAPTGPGELGDFEAELVEGTWSLSFTMGSFASATLNEWCLLLYQGCGAVPPSALTCEEVAEGIALAWVNGEAYDSLLVTRDDLTIAELDGASESYTDTVASPGNLRYRVIGVIDALECGSRSAGCAIGFGRIDACSAPALSILANFVVQTDTVEFVAGSDAEISDTEMYLNLTTTFVGNWDRISLVSPAGTSVQVHDNGGSFAEDFDVLFTDVGLDNTGLAPVTGTGIASIYDCGGCALQPSGPGTMADFSLEIANGTWTLEMLTFTVGTLNEWCVQVFPTVPAAPLVPNFRRADCNGDGVVSTLGDIIFLLNFTFNGGAVPPCMDAADCDGNGEVNGLADTLFLFEYSFNNGTAPPAPGPIDCGEDPPGDALECEFPPFLCIP